MQTEQKRFSTEFNNLDIDANFNFDFDGEGETNAYKIASNQAQIASGGIHYMSGDEICFLD